MSTMLDQAIIDAAALKEAALKNAEAVILEKYSNDLKDTIETLLEQESELDELDTTEEDSEIVEQMPLAATEGEPAGCPCPDENQIVTVNFDELATEMQEEVEEEGGLDAEEMTDREELADEIALDEELEFSDEDLSNLIEDISVDAEPVKSGWLETPVSDIVDAEDTADALEEQDEELEEDNEKEELKESLKTLLKRNDTLLDENNKYKQMILQLKDTVNEVNVQNAKLLYTNRALNSNSLNERQKNKIVETITKATTVEETKVIYETLLSTVGVQGIKNKRAKEPESLNEAVSRRSSTRLSVSKEETKVDPSIERMKKLAGID